MTVVKRPREGRRPALRGRGGVEGAGEVIVGNPKAEVRSPKWMQMSDTGKAKL
jgi:hypothetical protein